MCQVPPAREDVSYCVAAAAAVAVDGTKMNKSSSPSSNRKALWVHHQTTTTTTRSSKDGGGKTMMMVDDDDDDDDDGSGGMNSKQKQPRYHHKVLCIWLILGLGAAVGIYQSLTTSYIERRRENLSNMCNERAWMLQDQFNSSMNHVRSLTALVTTFHLAKQPSALDQATFAAYTARTSFERPLMSGVAYAQKISHSQREGFEKDKGWSIKDMRSNAPRSRHDEYAPTVLTQQTLSHLASVDMMSGEEDRENILRSRASGKGALTSPFRLLESHHLGVVLTFTVYKTDLPADATPEQRIQETAGYVGGAFDFESLVENLLRQLSESQTIIVNVNDVTNKSRPLIMYGPSISDGGKEMEVCQLEFGDPFRKHEMRCKFHNEATVVWSAITTTFGVVVIVLLVAQIFYAAGNRIARVEEDYRKMEELKVRAESADVAKSQFLATVSHEIRTPMNGVLGMLQMLMDTELDATQRDYAHTAHESGKQLIKLINEVLDQAKIESGRMELETVPFKLRNILDDILTLFSAENKDKGIELAAYVSERVPDVLLGDPVRLHQIITNLVGNSIKFTDRGHIFVSVHVAEDVKCVQMQQQQQTCCAADSTPTATAAATVTPASPPVAAPLPPWNTLSGLEAADRRNSWEIFSLILKQQEKSRLLQQQQQQVSLVFSVEDTGVGIPLHAQERVFSPFMQADSSTSRNYGGTGIGLSISKCLVELMKGDIGFVSRPGVGTTFWFTVTFKLGDLDMLAAAAAASSASSGGGAHNKQQQQQQQQQQHKHHQQPPPLTTQLAGLKALVVDGRPVRSQVTCYHLRRLGIQVDSANDMSSALTLVQNQRDMILIDKDAWGPATGLSFPIRLREAGFHTTSKLKLILLAFDDDDFQKARAAGFADVVIKKPLRASHIANHLEKALCLDHLLLNNRTNKSSSMPAPTATAAAPGSDILQHQNKINCLQTLLSGKLILVVDDNKVNRRVAAGALQKYGARVECVESGKLAIEKLQPPHKFDACFMDIQMPEMDGFEATRKIREAEQGRGHVPILAMTADVIQATYDECRRCGMDDYVSKPFEEKQLYRAVAKFFEKP